MNFSEAMFYENYLTSDSHTNTVISDACLPTRQNGVENRDKAYSVIFIVDSFHYTHSGFISQICDTRLIGRHALEICFCNCIAFAL